MNVIAVSPRFMLAGAKRDNKKRIYDFGVPCGSSQIFLSVGHLESSKQKITFCISIFRELLSRPLLFERLFCANGYLCYQCKMGVKSRHKKDLPHDDDGK